MTDDEIKSARALCDAATPGPWRTQSSAWPGQIDIFVAWGAGEPSTLKGRDWFQVSCGEDGRFIAAARTGWPAALDEIERLRKLFDDATVRTTEQVDCETCIKEKP